MTKYLLALAILTASTAASANAPNSIGIGVEAQINGTGGLALNYDGGKYDAGGFFGLVDPGTNGSSTSYQVGGRFFYHIHQTPTTDFGLGGSIGLDSAPDGNNNRQNLVFIEPAFQIRIFLATNVALSFLGGIVIGVADANGVEIGGQTFGETIIGAGQATGATAGAGITYYFN